ncbi:metallopeptidase M24 family protein [Artemisia annua]|uniref:Metallopeptidase M24 family protein n=1 Tax=Artemisia annua TaxID=35608 RepID=A0A2U1Q1U1_ARTAN|nr:metallopeptidase M24 family protein [Artemisia annua]
MMTDVVPYTFRQDAGYLHITRYQQNGGIVVLGHDFGLCMFMPEPSPHDVTWQGEIAGVDAETEYFKANQSYPISKLNKNYRLCNDKWRDQPKFLEEHDLRRS